MADFLDVKVKEIDDRLRELRPLVDEYHRLDAAKTALRGVKDDGGTRRRGPGRPRGSAKRRTRRRGSTRANQALDLVRAQPGVTIGELASAMKIKPNYLYRVLPALEKEGRVKRKGRGWHAV